MDFAPTHASEKIGFFLGYALSYVLFTTILFFVLTFTKHLPSTWSLFHVAAITGTVALIGGIVRWWLR